MAVYNDTITAVATARGTGGIAVIRISGPSALKIAGAVFESAVSAENMASHTVRYGKIKDGDDMIDRGVISVFKAPNSFTGENVAEISCHGGMLLTNRVLETVIKAGARLALPGEFTKRAFLNGKISLTEAEAVSDLISADSSLYLKASANLLEGKTGKAIKEAKESLSYLLANIFAVIDYPDEDIDELKKDDFKARLQQIQKILNVLKDSYSTGRIIKEGIKTVISGKPNTGKSMLMNSLTGKDRSIVTSKAGTTRDVIEESIVIGDLKLLLSDTAGIRNTQDEIEQIGVGRSLEEIKISDLVLFLIDGTIKISDEDKELFLFIKAQEKPVLILLNKIDKALKISEKEISSELGISEENILSVSAMTGEGLDALPGAIKRILKDKSIDFSRSEIILNERQFQCLLNSWQWINKALQNIDSGYPADIIAEDLTNALRAMGELDGSEVTDEIVKAVFKNFCVGK